MKKAFTKRTVIIGIIILMYLAALPLTLYFSGAFKQTELPNLKRLNMGFDGQFAVKTDEEKRGILSDIGFDVQAFKDGGFAIPIETMQISVFESEPSQLYSLSMEITDYDTYYINLTVYTPESDKQANRTFLRYQRREINGKSVGFYEQDDDSLSDKNVARYRNTINVYIYYVNRNSSIQDCLPTLTL